MTERSDLFPLFTELTLSADDATAIVAALHDVAAADGKHDDELAMIQGFIEALDADLGAVEPSQLPEMTPAKLAIAITDPEVRKVAIQSAVLLAWADGAISALERGRIVEYATALDFSPPAYEQIESAITAWVKSGDFGPLFAS
jgi:tellurite resistance protein